MKKFYTSNYKRCGNNHRAIGISLMVPDWFEYSCNCSFAPTSEMFKKFKAGEITEEEYTVMYRARLYEHDSLNILMLNATPSKSIFLCYEEPGEFCHRRILAEWIEERMGIKVKEWKSKDELKEEAQNKIVDSLIKL